MSFLRCKPAAWVGATLALVLLTASCSGQGSDSAPAQLGMSDSATATSGSTDSGLKRTSADGIVLTAEQIMFDYGDGPQLSLSIRGDHPDGLAGVQMGYDLEATTATIDSVGWAASADTYVVMVEVGADVAEVQLTSTEGHTDRAIPTERFALLGIRTANPDGVTLQAMDASGAIVGTCAQDDFFTCTPAS